MAVIKAKREDNPLEVLVQSTKLVTHTITLCKNEKHFPKRDRWILTAPIVKSALKVYQHIRKANAVRVETESDYRRRMKRQKKAIEELQNLMGLIDIAGTVAEISGDSIKFWTGMCEELLKLTRAWHRSDQKRLLQEIDDEHADFRSSMAMGFALFICAANWWLRTPNVGNANNVRNVNTSGALNNNNANNANGVAPDCVHPLRGPNG